MCSIPALRPIAFAIVFACWVGPSETRAETTPASVSASPPAVADGAAWVGRFCTSERCHPQQAASTAIAFGIAAVGARCLGRRRESGHPQGA